MRLRPLIPTVIVLSLALAGAPPAPAQTLVCPPSSAVSSRPCDTFHFHVQMYRPDTRAVVDLYGIDQFASLPACERARDAASKRNAAVVAFMKPKDAQYGADQFGPCHCDMTIEKGSPLYLTDMLRISQIRQAEEIRQRVRERLLDYDVPTDSELIRGLYPQPTASAAISGPRLVPPPAVAPVTNAANAPADLKLTKTTESATPSSASLDLPLVEIPIAGVAPDALPVPPATTTGPVAPAPAPEPALPEERVPADAPPTPVPPPVTPAPAPAPSPTPVPATPQTRDPATPAPPEPAIEEAAETFIAYETDRIQNVLKASGAISDDAIKSKIFEACMQRIQLLSNLRSLIAGSGVRSRLGAAVHNIKSESDRLALVGALFGTDMPAHWAPHDAKDVVLEASPQADGDAEKILRDDGSHYTAQQKRRALYVVLARTQPTEEQQLWLWSVIDALLQ